MISSEDGIGGGNSVNDVSRETRERLTVFVDLLIRWQKSINLIAPSTIPDVWSRHVRDSLVCGSHSPHIRHWVDLGSGAGFPGLITAIVLAEKGQGRVDLIESNGKKCAFLNAVVRETGLRAGGVDIQIHNGRIEEILPQLDKPEAISARALAPLRDLLDLTKNMLKSETMGSFLKGQDYESELQEARQVWDFDCNVIVNEASQKGVLLEIHNVAPIAEGSGK